VIAIVTAAVIFQAFFKLATVAVDVTVDVAHLIKVSVLFL